MIVNVQVQIEFDLDIEVPDGSSEEEITKLSVEAARKDAGLFSSDISSVYWQIEDGD